MKFKPAHKSGKILVELDSDESLPLLDGTRENGAPRFRLKNILVPIDFSDCSKKALAYAVPYAKEFGAQITLLYVAQFHYAACELDSAEAPVKEAQHRARASRELSKLAKEIPSDLNTKIAVASGKPFVEIVFSAKSLGADLIIIGTHGAMGQHRESLGSTAERVIRYADCPVLIVRERARDFVVIPDAEERGRERSSL